MSNVQGKSSSSSNAMTFLRGRRLSSSCCSSQDMIFSCTEQTRSIHSPCDVEVWVRGKEAMLTGSLARSGILCSNSSLLLTAQPHHSHLHSLILQGLGGPEALTSAIAFGSWWTPQQHGLSLGPQYSLQTGSRCQQCSNRSSTRAVCS